jgi:hypothetical protein
VEVRGFEPLTPCMPSARDPFTRVQIRPNRLRLLGFQFISVHRNSLQFKSTAEVNAEVNPLRAVQGVRREWRILGITRNEFDKAKKFWST